MRYWTTISVVLVLWSFFVLPVRSFSEVKISLRNGRDIIADSCRDTKDKLICEKMGGTFEIEQKDILDVKGITIERSPSQQVPEENTGQEAASGQKVPVQPEADLKGIEKQPGGDLVKGLKPEEEERLGQINQKKRAYQTERQLLINERQQLHEDVKNTDMIKTQEQFDAIKKRISDLETRINTFNEDVRKLNDEERKILERSKNDQ